MCVCLQFLGLIISSPFANLQFDTQAVQNWEGFWLMLVINCLYHFNYSTIPIYLVKFAIIHREIHNEVYSLSAYYIAELIIMVCNVNDFHRFTIIINKCIFQFVWIMIKMLIYCVAAFTVVGVEWTSTELFVFFLIAFSAFSYGNLTLIY